MSATLYPAGRPAAMAEVLDAGFRLFRATILQTLPYGLLAMLASKLPHLYPLGAHAAGAAIREPRWWLLDGIGGLLVALFSNAIAGRQQVSLGAVAAGGFRRDLRSALRRLPATALLLILMMVAVCVWFVPLLYVPGTHLTAWASLAALPAIWILVMCPSAWLAIVVGERGMLTGIGYAWQLVRGHWWRCFAIYLTGVAVLAVFMAFAGVVSGLVLTLAGNANLAVMTALSAEIALAVAAVALPFYIALALAVYRDLVAWHSAQLPIEP